MCFNTSFNGLAVNIQFKLYPTFGRGIFDRIGQQVGQDMLQEIGVNHYWVVGNVAGELELVVVLVGELDLFKNAEAERLQVNR